MSQRADVVIFGGGVAGLWLLDLLVTRGYRAILIEAKALGSGQTIASQGILHGGFKYTLDGLFSKSAEAIKELPRLWRDRLEGRGFPDLRATALRAEYCHLWRSGRLRSQVKMLGARMALAVKPHRLDRAEWPTALAGCRTVSRLDEQVLDPASLLTALAAHHQERLLLADEAQVELQCLGPGKVFEIRVDRVGSIMPGQVVFTAGQGNEVLRRHVGLPPMMQRRPLHMVMARGELPVLNGHSVDGRKTRVTITTTRDSRGRAVWQLGGNLAETGVDLDRPALIAHACQELAAVLPGFLFGAAELSTYRVDRAEQASEGGRRPSEAFAERMGNVVTGWPTKLVLAPRLALKLAELLDPPGQGEPPMLGNAARPIVALPPWETETEWYVAS